MRYDTHVAVRDTYALRRVAHGHVEADSPQQAAARARAAVGEGLGVLGVTVTECWHTAAPVPAAAREGG